MSFAVRILLAGVKFPANVRYATLSKFDVQIAPAETIKLQQLRPSWKEFLEMLDESQHSLDKSKVNMKRDLEANLEGYSHLTSSIESKSKSYRSSQCRFFPSSMPSRSM